MKKLLLTGAAAATGLIAMSAFAQVPAPAPAATQAHMQGHSQNRAEVAQHVQAMFASLDSDRNGWLTKAEADAGKSEMRDRMGKHGDRRADHTFEQLDTDRNGSISRAEFDTAHAKRADRVAERRDRKGDHMAKGGMAGHMMGGRMFEMSDSNKDGRVSLQEATNAALQHFDMADANRDGQITREERTQMRQRMRTERRPG
jgi:Ca2+-binding EF-hand superfamily protein